MDVMPKLRCHFRGHKQPISSVSFHPSGKQLASSSNDDYILLWEIGPQMNSIKYLARKEPFKYVRFSPSGNHMASCQGPYVRLWVPKVRSKSSEFKPHVTTIRSVNFSPDGKKLLTASDDKSVKLTSIEKFKFVASFTGHTNWVRSAKFSPDGSLIVSNSDDKSTKLWDPKAGKIIHTFSELKGIPKCADFHPRGNSIGVGLTHNVVKVYDLRNLQILQHYTCHKGSVNTLSFHPDGQFLITGSDDCSTKVIDLVEGRQVFSLRGHTGPVTAVEFSKSGKSFATASEDKQILVWKSNLDFELIKKSSEELFLVASQELSNRDEEEKKRPGCLKEEPQDEPYSGTAYSVSDYQDNDENLNHYNEDSTYAVPKSESYDFLNSSENEFIEAIKSLTVENSQLKDTLKRLEQRVIELEEKTKVPQA